MTTGLGLGFSTLAAATPLALFDDAVAIIQAENPAGGATAPVFAQRAAKLRQSLGANPDEQHERQALTALLASEGGSGPRLLGSDDQEYWSVLSCFSGKLDGARLKHIGAWFERHGKRWFLREVWPGGPAARAGLRRGDEVVDADGSPLEPVASFTKLKAGEKVALRFRRLPWEQPRRVLVEPVTASFQESLLAAMDASHNIRNVGGKRIAYVPLPMSAHPAFRQLLNKLASASEIEADAMVLDLRGDYGGVGLTYAEPFLAIPGPHDTAATPPAVAPYGKPLVVLVDGGTSSGREQLAGFLQSQHRAILVGAPTAGATAPGRAFEVIPQRFLLWLPTAASGLPLLPEVPVEASLLYAAGSDPQLDRGLSEAAKGR